MVQLTLPLLDNTDNESGGNASDPNCDPSQSIYNKKYCIKDFLFCSDDNPCPSKIPCVDRVCQCLPNTKQYITLTPLPVRMYTIGCNFNKKRDAASSCRDYEYGVSGTCLLNYCSSEVPCYAGNCDNKNNVCVNITSARETLPISSNAPITLGNDPFGTNKEGISPTLFVLIICGGIAALALVGCIIRTILFWTKSSVAWASGSLNKDSASMTDEKDPDSMGSAAGKGRREMLEDEEGDENAPAILRVPSKFTGRHYLPSPPVMFSNEISPFSSPMPSPRFSPYSQPNQSQVSSNHSLMNPFRQPGIQLSEDVSAARAIELSDRSRPSTSSSGSAPHEDAHIPGNENNFQRPEALNSGSDLRIARSQTLSRDFTTTPSAAIPPMNRRIGGGGAPPTTLQKSNSMLQLGSRPAPPPPSSSLHKSRSNLSSAPLFPVSAPLPSIPGESHQQQRQLLRSSTVITSADLQGPSFSLDSILGFSTNSNSADGGSDDHEKKPHNTSTDLTSLTLDSPNSLSPSLHSLTSVGGGPSMPLLQSAEKHPSLTVPARHSMLKHSASVPQMMYASSTAPSPALGGPSSRNLPAGFASSPIADSEERFRS